MLERNITETQIKTLGSLIRQVEKDPDVRSYGSIEKDVSTESFLMIFGKTKSKEIIIIAQVRSVYARSELRTKRFVKSFGRVACAEKSIPVAKYQRIPSSVILAQLSSCADSHFHMHADVFVPQAYIASYLT